MLLCKGHGCRYRKTCRRYVLGTIQAEACDATWIDHCPNIKKFEKATDADKYIPIKDKKQ